MDKVNGKLTIFFEEPFWVGIFERIEDGKLSAVKVTFGAEPKDCEVQEYIQKWYFSLKFSPVVETVVKDIKRNPQRMQREAKKQMLEIGIGTKSQQALKLQQERKEKSRKRKEAEEQQKHQAAEQKDFEMNMDTSGLAVAGHIGTWLTIGHMEVDGHTFWLMEHDTYGDDAACIIVDDHGKLSLANVYDGFDEHTVDLLRQEVMPVDRMPDDSITVDEMKEYGYGWGGMLPMREEATVASI